MSLLEKALKELETCLESLQKGGKEVKEEALEKAKSTSHMQTAPVQPVRQWGRPVQFFGAVPKQQEPLQKAIDTAVIQVPTIASNPSNLCEVPVGPLGTYMPRKIDFSKLSGPQMIALKLGLDPSTPNLEQMSLTQMKDLVRKNAEDVARPQRRALGIPDPVEQPRNYAIPSY